MTYAALAHAYATWPAENLNRFSSCLGMHRFRQLSAISAANRKSAKRRTTISDWRAPEGGVTPHKRTSGQWKDSHSGEGVFLYRDYFRVARHSGTVRPKYSLLDQLGEFC